MGASIPPADPGSGVVSLQVADSHSSWAPPCPSRAPARVLREAGVAPRCTGGDFGAGQVKDQLGYPESWCWCQCSPMAANASFHPAGTAPLLFIGISQEQGISVATRAKFSVQSSSAAAAPIAR